MILRRLDFMIECIRIPVKICMCGVIFVFIYILVAFTFFFFCFCLCLLYVMHQSNIRIVYYISSVHAQLKPCQYWPLGQLLLRIGRQHKLQHVKRYCRRMHALYINLWPVVLKDRRDPWVAVRWVLPRFALGLASNSQRWDLCLQNTLV